MYFSPYRQRRRRTSTGAPARAIPALIDAAQRVAARLDAEPERHLLAEQVSYLREHAAFSIPLRGRPKTSRVRGYLSALRAAALLAGWVEDARHLDSSKLSDAQARHIGAALFAAELAADGGER